jgi:hypothetical protein
MNIYQDWIGSAFLSVENRALAKCNRNWQVALTSYPSYGLFSLISIPKVLDPDGLAVAVTSIHMAYFAFEAVVKASHWVGRVPNCVHSLVRIVLVLL